jgi:hypothetical protein
VAKSLDSTSNINTSFAATLVVHPVSVDLLEYAAALVEGFALPVILLAFVGIAAFAFQMSKVTVAAGLQTILHSDILPVRPVTFLPFSPAKITTVEFTPKVIPKLPEAPPPELP